MARWNPEGALAMSCGRSEIEVVEVGIAHGRWERYPDALHRKCSVCKKEYNIVENHCIPSQHCPNCGAKMDGKKVE